MVDRPNVEFDMHATVAEEVQIDLAPDLGW